MKKRRLKLLCLFLTASMTAPTILQYVPGSMSLPYEVQAAGAEDAAENVQVSARDASDGIDDAWTQDPESVSGSGAVCAVEDGWLHLKSDPSNGNNPGTKPAIFVNPNTFDFSQEGFFDFTLKSNNGNTGQNDSDRFGVYLGYNTDQNGMFVGYDNGGWFWQKYTGGSGDWYQGSRHAAPAQGEEAAVHIEWTADHKMTLTLDGETVFENEDFSGIVDVLGTQIAFKCGSWNQNTTDVLVKDIHYTGQAETAVYPVTGKVLDTQGSPIEGAKVTIGDTTVETDAEGTYTVELPDGTYTVTVVKDGYMNGSGSITVSGQEASVGDITLDVEPDIETETLSTEDMDVYVSKTFPSVVKYEMKGGLEGKTFYGQTEAINTVRINGVDIQVAPEDVKAEFDGTTATYVMTVKNEEKHIDAEITAELKAEANQLAFNITKIENKLQDQTTTNKYGDKVETYPLQTIGIPNHSLISVRSTQSGANLKGAVMSSNTHKSGDELIQVNGDMGSYNNRDYMYAFLSTDEMSAGMWSNSEHEGRTVAAPVYGGSQNTRIYATSEERDGYKTMGLASAEWYYHRNVTDSKGVQYTVTETEMPQSKIVIAGDMNEDAQVNWQDGAIAFRDIMNNPYKSEEVPELVAWRIAMNFGGQAQNPFLTTLDNVKRVAQHTDGLGQSILLKGYASEGHDSGHPDYDNIGERMGGAEDMNTLMEKGAEYGARFGIHVNASEMYPEAKAFSEELVRRNSAGALSYGWNWLDQGIGIDGIYDLASGERQARFDALKEKVGDNMDFVYVDVWGNLTSGNSEDSWETRKLSDMITDNGWRMTTEWGSGNEYDSTFQHWACDLTYGGYTSKGENSEVMRFLRNHQKDSWVGDYPSYGGVANAPLLGGYNMKDFEGWQGRNDYDAYITNLYTHDLMTKFLQHYQVVKWEDGDPVQMTDNGETYAWTPEKEITLKADPKKSSAETDTVVVTRGSTDPSDAAYRDRTVTLNGIVISQGSVTQGDNTNAKGTESYLIPWNWDSETGDQVASEEEKLYHWNTQGGETTWELQDSWKNLTDVKVYKLTDLGKTEEQTIPVVDGTITLTAEAETPYVVCKGDEANLEITWSEGMHIVDAGFNSGNDGLNEYWEKSGEGTAEIAKSQYSNPMLKMDGEVSMTQELTDLKAGEEYAVYVGVDNRSGAKASMTVKADDKVLDSNYTEESIAKNYVKAYTHSNSSATVDGTSYFQNMYVFFTAPESGTVTLTLSREAGEGSTYFDDIRVVESEMDVVKKDEDGNVVGMEQDFENNAQGIYPFVVGGIEGVEDNRTHLSELHDPYTQAGWDVKKMDDVLDGNWSVKTNGLTQRNALVYQTIPQNFRFEPGRTYKVSFDYQAGSDGTYGVTVGDGEFEGGTSLETLDMAMGPDQDGHYETTITGSASGQTWFGIYSTGTAPDLQGTSGSAANFGGYQDFVLDNLKIELVDEEVTADSLQVLIEEAETGYDKTEYLDADWAVFQSALTDAKVALNKDKQDQKQIEDAYYALKAAMMTLDTASGTEADDKYDIASDKYTVEAGSAQPQSGNEGPVEFAQDGNGSTHWHTSWSADVVEADGSGDGWYQFNFSEPMTVNGMRYLPRSGAANANGKIIKADILVSSDNGASWETAVKDAEFSTTTMWQKVSFDAVEGVTNVRIVATETAGQSAAEANKYVSAAELRVLQPVEDQTETADKSALEAAVSGAEGLNSGDYTEESWKTVEEKLAEAKAVLEKEDATAYDIALALANLNDAVADLEKSENPQPGEEISTAVLEYAIELAGGVNTDGVIETVKENFENALQNAQDILAKVQSGDASVTQNQVDNAWRNLIKAMQYMEFKEANKDDLAKVIALAEEMNGKLDKYLDEGKAAFTTALTEAKEVYENEIATQEEVTSAWQNLLDAMANMMLKPDKGLLEDLIAQAEGLNEADYEAQSFAVMRTALAAAKEVFDNADADQEEIDASASALKDAIAKLTPAAGTDQSGNGGQSDSTGGSKTEGQTAASADKNSSTASAGKTSSTQNSGSAAKATKTGDTANALPFAAAAAAALAAGAAVLLKKKEEN